MSEVNTTMTPAQCADALEALLNETRQELYEAERDFYAVKKEVEGSLSNGSEDKLARVIVESVPAAERYTTTMNQLPEEVKTKFAAIRSALENHIASGGVGEAENAQNEKYRSALRCLEQIAEKGFRYGSARYGLYHDEIESALATLRNR